MNLYEVTLTCSVRAEDEEEALAEAKRHVVRLNEVEAMIERRVGE